MDRSSKPRINKETQILNETLNQIDLIDIFGTFHRNTEEYTFFSSAHGTVSRIDHILDHKSSLSKFKKIEIVLSIFWLYAMRLDINYREKKKTAKNTNSWWLNNTLLNNKEVTEEIKEEIKRCLEKKWQWKHDDPKPMGLSKSSSKREVYSNTSISQEERKTSNRQPNSTSKAAWKRRTKTTQSQQKEGNHKNQSRNKWKRNKGNNSKD